MKSDIEIAQEAKMKPIADIAAGLGLADEDVIPYGRYKAKVNHRLIHKASKQGKLILVTAITPTALEVSGFKMPSCRIVIVYRGASAG